MYLHRPLACFIAVALGDFCWLNHCYRFFQGHGTNALLMDIDLIDLAIRNVESSQPATFWVISTGVNVEPAPSLGEFTGTNAW